MAATEMAECNSYLLYNTELILITYDDKYEILNMKNGNVKYPALEILINFRCYLEQWRRVQPQILTIVPVDNFQWPIAARIGLIIKHAEYVCTRPSDDNNA